MEPLKHPASPGTPLFPLTPSREPNNKPPVFGTPSMTVDPFALHLKTGSKSPFKHSRNNSDAMVQGMIARFDTLSVKDYKTNADNALKRVEIAREMAEHEAAKLRETVNVKEEEVRRSREENRKMGKELEGMKERERKVSRRLEVVLVSCFLRLGGWGALTNGRRNLEEARRLMNIREVCLRRKSKRRERKRSNHHLVC